MEFLRKYYQVQSDFIYQVEVEVGDCPKGVEAVLMSGVTYALVKKLEQVVGSEVNPCPIAAKIIEIAEDLCCTESRKTFDISIGGSGFINASPTLVFFPMMIKSFLINGWESFFTSSAMILGEPQTSESELNTIRSQYKEFAYSEQQLTTNSNDDVRLLIKARAEQGVNRETALMAAALLGDDEFDVNTYLRKINGNENVPWFISRFIVDVTKYEQELLSRVLIGNFEVDNVKVPAEAVCAQDLILKFRQVLFGAVKVKRPEVLLRHLLEMMRAFYLYYNHPRWRMIRGDISPYQVLYHITQAIKKMVLGGLYVLDFSCDSQSFVLDRDC